MQVIVDNLATTYSDTGKGQTILLLHGWGDRADGLKGLGSSLLGKYRIIALDLPGFSGSEKPQTAWGLSEYANFINHFLLKLKIDKVFAIIGHSNGGAIAIRGVSSSTLKTEKLILLASSGIRTPYQGRRKALRLLVKAGKALSSPLPTHTKKKLKAKVYKSIGSDMLVAEHMQETFKKIVTDDVQADTKKINVPTLIMYGGEDKTTPVDYGELFNSQISNSELTIVPEAGHFLHLDQPSAVEDKIKDFLK